MTSTIVEALEGIRRILSIVARFTPSEVDDKVVKLIDAILASPELLAWFEDLLGMRVQLTTESHAQHFATISPKLADAAAQAGVDWLELIQTLLPYLLQLLNFFIKQQEEDKAEIDYTPGTTSRCQQ